LDLPHQSENHGIFFNLVQELRLLENERRHVKLKVKNLISILLFNLDFTFVLVLVLVIYNLLVISYLLILIVILI